MLKIVSIKADVNESLKNIEGMKILVKKMEFKTHAEYIALAAMTLEDNKKLFETLFNIWGERWINKNYKEFVKHHLDENEEKYIFTESDIAREEEVTRKKIITSNNSIEEFVEELGFSMLEMNFQKGLEHAFAKVGDQINVLVGPGYEDNIITVNKPIMLSIGSKLKIEGKTRFVKRMSNDENTLVIQC